MASESMCTCWVVTTELGTRVPAGWVTRHPEVRLVCRDGRIVTGWALDPSWCGTDEGAIPLLEVEVEGSEDVVASKDEIATLTPLGGYDDLLAFREAVDRTLQIDAAALLANPDLGELTLIVDAHTTLEVSAVVRRHGCSPGSPPP